MPQPVPIDKQILDERTLGAHRNVFCPTYSICLNYSVHAGWDDWTCRECPLNGATVDAPKARDFAHSRREDPLGR
jgi:hypothetical protein